MANGGVMIHNIAARRHEWINLDNPLKRAGNEEKDHLK
jgi:hypothetical protein